MAEEGVDRMPPKQTHHDEDNDQKKDKKGRVAKTVGVPGEDEELFPEWEEYLRLESEGGSNLIDINGADTGEVANGDGPDPDSEAVEAGTLVSTEA